MFTFAIRVRVLTVITFALLIDTRQRQRFLRDVPMPVVIVGVRGTEIEIYTIQKEPGHFAPCFFNHRTSASNSFFRRFPRSNYEANILDSSDYT